MNIFDKNYKKKEKNIIKFSHTILLSKILLLNYEYNGKTITDFEKIEFEK